MVARGTQNHGGSSALSAKAPPGWMVLSVLLLGGLLVGATTWGAYLRVHPPEPEQSPRPASAGADTDARAKTTSPVLEGSDWTTLLHSSDCPTPCAGGTACGTKTVDCTSGFTCVPGTGREMLDATETWKFRLNAVSSIAPDGTQADPCQSGRDFWVCLSGTTSCLSQREACSGSKKFALSSDTLPLPGAELLGRGIVLEVREGGPEGPVVGRTSPIHDLARGGLCKGFRVGVKGETVTGVYYFVEPG